MTHDDDGSGLMKHVVKTERVNTGVVDDCG